KVLETVGRHLGVPDRVLNVLVPEVVLQSPCVVAIIGELKTTGMVHHVGVDRERHLGSLADALDEALEADGTDWPAALGNEHVSLFRVLRGGKTQWQVRSRIDQLAHLMRQYLSRDRGLLLTHFFLLPYRGGARIGLAISMKVACFVNPLVRAGGLCFDYGAAETFAELLQPLHWDA